jgi:DNA-binding CsgD family transcriptional regulator
VPRNRTSIAVPISTAAKHDLPPEQQALTRIYLTERQIQMLFWVYRGKSGTDIGGIFGISPRTVEHHLAKACEALEVRSRFQAAMKADGFGLFSLVSP